MADDAEKEVMAEDPATGFGPKTVSQQETPEDQIYVLPGEAGKFDPTTGAAFPNPEAPGQEGGEKARDL